MDLTVETKQYVFSASSGFDYIVIYFSNQLKLFPNFGSKFELTKKEVKTLIEYLKENWYEDGRASWIIDSLVNMEMLMVGKEKAQFRFW